MSFVNFIIINKYNPNCENGALVFSFVCDIIILVYVPIVKCSKYTKQIWSITHSNYISIAFKITFR